MLLRVTGVVPTNIVWGPRAVPYKSGRERNICPPEGECMAQAWLKRGSSMAHFLPQHSILTKVFLPGAWAPGWSVAPGA